MSDQVFEKTENDSQAVEILKEELHSAERGYKRTLRSHATLETKVCTFNFLVLQKQFDKVQSLKLAILKLVDQDHLWVEL